MIQSRKKIYDKSAFVINWQKYTLSLQQTEADYENI